MEGRVGAVSRGAVRGGEARLVLVQLQPQVACRRTAAGSRLVFRSSAQGVPLAYVLACAAASLKQGTFCAAAPVPCSHVPHVSHVLNYGGFKHLNNKKGISS